MDPLKLELVKVIKRRGSLQAVAAELGVPPKTLANWIVGVGKPMIAETIRVKAQAYLPSFG